MSRKKKLQKKIAVAVSVVNLLNMSAPLVLPYVNVAGQVPAAGGQIVQFADTAQSVLYRTAQAAEYNARPRRRNITYLMEQRLPCRYRR